MKTIILRLEDKEFNRMQKAKFASFSPNWEAFFRSMFNIYKEAGNGRNTDK